MSVLRTLPSGGVVFLRTRNGHPKIRGSLISYARDPWIHRRAGILKSEEASSRMPAAFSAPGIFHLPESCSRLKCVKPLPAANRGRLRMSSLDKTAVSEKIFTV